MVSGGDLQTPKMLQNTINESTAGMLFNLQFCMVQLYQIMHLSVAKF